MKLDFSEFHPLDHWVGDRRCRSLPGGTGRHVELWYQYQWVSPVGWLLCLLGRHDTLPHWTYGRGPSETWPSLEELDDTPPDGWLCSRCWKEGTK